LHGSITGFFTTFKKTRVNLATEGQMMEMKGVARRKTQLLDDLRNRRRYWELNEDAAMIITAEIIEYFKRKISM
jgi:hypothetical protein